MHRRIENGARPVFGSRLGAVAVLALLLGLLGPAAGVWAHQNPAGKTRMMLAVDVSNSMGDTVLPDQLPEDLAFMRDRMNAIQDSPDYVRLNEERKAILEDPDVMAVNTAYADTGDAVEGWLVEHGYLERTELDEKLQKKLDGLGCNGWASEIIGGMDSMESVEAYLADICEGADVPETERQKILQMTRFVSVEAFQILARAEKEAGQDYQDALTEKGYYDVSNELERLLNTLNYTDLQEQVNVRAKEMGYPTRLDLARQTADLLLNIAHLDYLSTDRVTEAGLVSYANRAILNQGLTDDYDILQRKIDDLKLRSSTNLSDGLMKALDEIEKSGDKTTPSAIILLSDGEANTGWPAQQIVQQIPERANRLNTRICAIGFGTREQDIDAEVLQKLAETTHGQYVFAHTGDELVSFFVACRQGLISEHTDTFTGVVFQGETVEAGRVSVGEATDALTVTLTYLTGDMEMVLLDPNGKEVGAEYPGAKIQQNENAQLITIQQPLASQWVVRVRARKAPEDGAIYNVVVGTEKKAGPVPTETPVPVGNPSIWAGMLPTWIVLGGGGLAFLALAAGWGIFLLIRRRTKQPLRAPGWVALGVTLVVGFCCLSAGLGGVTAARVAADPSQKILAFLPSSPTPAASETPRPTATFTPIPTLPPRSTPTTQPAPDQAVVMISAEWVKDLAGMGQPVSLDTGVLTLAVSPAGDLLAVPAYFSIDGQSERQISFLKILGRRLIPYMRLPGHAEALWSLKFSPDGSLLASASKDMTVKIWDVQAGKWLRTLEGHTDEVTDVAFSPDGSLLASCSMDDTVRIWNVSDGSLLKTLNKFNYDVYSVDFSPDGTLLATGSQDLTYTVTLWDTTKWEIVKNLRGHSDSVYEVAFSPDGKLLATGGYESDIRVWSIPDGAEIQDLAGHSDAINFLDFSADGKLLASGSSDKTVRVWVVDPSSQSDSQDFVELTGHTDEVHDGAFSTDGSLLFTTGGDRTIRTWGIEP